MNYFILLAFYLLSGAGLAQDYEAMDEMSLRANHGTLNREIKKQESFVRVGDLIIEKKYILDEKDKTNGFISKGVNLWNQGMLPYVFSSRVGSTERSLFLKSCREMGRYANVFCEPRRSGDKDYIYVDKTSENICGSSLLGRSGGRQTVKIKCWVKRTIQHELMHALGIPHEQNRPDRDQYIDVVWSNMESSLKSSYRKVSINSVQAQLGIYDYKSVLHYPSMSGSRNGKPVTYKLNNGKRDGIIDVPSEMSFYDHYFLVYLYGGEKPRF